MSENNAYGRKVPSSDAKKFELGGLQYYLRGLCDYNGNNGDTNDTRRKTPFCDLPNIEQADTDISPITLFSWQSFLQ